MERPRLFIAVTSPMSAGFFEGQLAWLRDQGFDVHFLSAPGQPAEDITAAERATFHPVSLERNISPWRDLCSLWQIIGILRRVRPQIVNTGTPKAGLLVMLAAWYCRVPVRIYTIHGLRFETVRGLLRKVLIAIERLVCACAHQVLCVSTSLREVVLAHRLCPDRKTLVLANGSINGIDTDGSGDRDWSAVGLDVRKSLGIPADAPVVGFVGRVVKDKGIHELVTAWAGIRARIADAHLVMVGGFEAGDPIQADDETALRSDPRVHLTGFLREVRLMYTAMDVLTLPSYREGLGLVLLEAGTMGLPVVASDIPGCRDAVVDQVTGVLVPAHDAHSLEEALVAYLTQADLRRRHGEAGREHVRQRFSRATVWRAFSAYYRALAAGPAGSRARDPEKVP